MLFIVPELADGIFSGIGCERAPKRISTILCDVSTFPPAVAAGY